jgi:hypothetical protein
LLGTLRKIYGESFAPDHNENDKLSDFLANLHETSLTPLVHDHTNGNLESKVRKASLG